MLWKMKNIILIGLAVLILQNASAEAGPVSKKLQVNTIPKREEQYDVRELQLSEKCFRASGSNETFIDLQTAKSNVSRCMSGLFPYPLVNVIDAYTTYSAGNLRETIEKYCSMKSDIISCFASFLTTLERCMENNDEKKFLHFLTKSLTTVSEYLCYNDGERIRTLVKEGGLECWNNNAWAKRCFYRSGSLKIMFMAAFVLCWSNNVWEAQRCFYESKSLNTLYITAYDDGFVFNQNTCTDIPNYDYCVLDELRICKNTVVTDFQNGLHNATNRILPCNFTAEI